MNVRDKFERWAIGQGFDVSKDTYGDYHAHGVMQRWQGYEAASIDLREREPMIVMGDDKNEWYLDAEQFYIDIVKALDTGSYSIFFRNRKTGLDLFLDQDAIFTEAERLDFILEHDETRLCEVSDGKWSVMDCSDGITFPVEGQPTSRAALDAIMQKMLHHPDCVEKK